MLDNLETLNSNTRLIKQTLQHCNFKNLNYCCKTKRAHFVWNFKKVFTLRHLCFYFEISISLLVSSTKAIIMKRFVKKKAVWRVFKNIYKFYYCSPAYSTGLTVVLLLILVKQVANVTVILPKLHMTLLASLLRLKEWYLYLTTTYTNATEIPKGKQLPVKITEWSCYSWTLELKHISSQLPSALFDTQSTAPLGLWIDPSGGSPLHHGTADTHTVYHSRVPAAYRHVITHRY